MNLMKNNNQIAFIALVLGCFFLSSCEVNTGDEVIDPLMSESLSSSLDGVLDYMYDEPGEAVKELDGIIEQAKTIPSPYFAGKALWYQAYLYDKKIEDVSKAYFGYNEALKYLNQTDDAVLRTKVRNNLATLNQFYGHYDLAIDTYLKVIEEKEKIDKKLLSNIYYNLGRTYKLKGDQDSFLKAEKAFTNSLQVAKAIEDHENIASVNNQVGMMYKDLQDYDMARIAYENTIRDYQEFDRESEAWEYVGKAFHGIGVTYMEERRYDLAIQSFEQALNYEKNSGTIFITKYDLGTVLYESGQMDRAVDVWRDALNEKHNKSDRIQVQIYAKLTTALATSGEHKEAVKYAQIYNGHIHDILTIGEKYRAKNNQVIFADIIREYDEFNQVIPFYKEPWAIALMFLFIAVAVYAGSHAYYQSKLSTKVSDTRSEIQVEFQNIKID